MRLLLAAALLLTAAPPLRADDATILGKAGDIQLTTTEAREAIAGLEATGDAPLAKDPAAIGQYLRALLIQRLVIQQAQSTHFDKQPDVIAKLVRARETALSEAYLASHSQPPAEYPSQEELDQAYQAAKPQLLIPRTHHLAQIHAKDEATIRRLHQQATAKGADFAQIAKAHSEEKTSAANGGQIGWLAEEQIQPPIRDILPTLKTDGAISSPVKLNDGWHIIRRIATREPRTATLDEVKERLTAQLRAEKARQLRNDFLADLLKNHPLAINEIELNKILSAP